MRFTMIFVTVFLLFVCLPAVADDCTVTRALDDGWRVIDGCTATSCDGHHQIVPQNIRHRHFRKQTTVARLGCTACQARHSHCPHAVVCHDCSEINHRQLSCHHRKIEFVSGQVNVKQAHFRTGPSTSHKVIRIVKRGTGFTLLCGCIENNFVPVLNVATNEQGWIHASLLDVTTCTF